MTGQIHDLPESVILQAEQVPSFSNHTHVYPKIAVVAFRVFFAHDVAVNGVPVCVAGQILVPIIDPTQNLRIRISAGPGDC